MKLAKLSLAAIMAVGALSTANAQPLEEAIKGVDFSGFVRYNLNVSEGTIGERSSANDWDVLGKVVAPVTDNVKATVAFATSGSENAEFNGGNSTNKTSNGVGRMDFDIAKAFFTYTNASKTTLKAGLMALGTPITDNGFNGNKGTGVVVMQGVGPVTLAGAYFSGINGYNVDGADIGLSLAKDRDIMAVAALGSFGPVNAQVWGFKVQDLVDSMIFTQVDGKFAGFKLAGQWINTKLDSKVIVNGTDTAVKDVYNDDSGDFYAIKAGWANEQFFVDAGYTMTDGDMPIFSPFAAPADTSIIAGGWRLAYSAAAITGDTDTMFVNAGAKFGKIGVKVGYAQADIGSKSVYEGADPREIWGQVSYAVAKNLSTYVKYGDLSAKSTHKVVNSEDYYGDDIDQKYFRFEAKYTF